MNDTNIGKIIILTKTFSSLFGVKELEKIITGIGLVNHNVIWNFANFTKIGFVLPAFYLMNLLLGDKYANITY